jgi:hypothetical protein
MGFKLELFEIINKKLSHRHLGGGFLIKSLVRFPSIHEFPQK